LFITKIIWADCPTKIVETLIKTDKIMKRRNLISIAAICLYLGLGVVFTSCDNVKNVDYTQKTTEQFNELKPPVVLFSKTKSMGLYGVSVVDGNGKLHTFGNMSSLANGIGEIYAIGDTLK